MSAIFLDRDGVVIRKAPEGDYVKDWSEVEFLPGSLEAIAAFTKLGRKVIIVTNQRGLATGQIRRENMEVIHSKIQKSVEKCGGQITAIYYCPHDKHRLCDCRKPKPGMLLQAATEHDLRLPDCWMIGDKASDIAAGKTAGCKTALITRSIDHQMWVDKPDFCAENLAIAAKQILLVQS